MEQPIRVLHVLGKFDIGGIENFIMTVYRRIDRTKIQFDFVLHSEKKGFYEDEVLSLGGRIYNCPTLNPLNYFSYKKWWKKFLSDKKNDYQIIHSHYRSTASIYLEIAKKLSYTTIMHSHSTGVYGGNRIKKLMKYFLQRNIYKFSDYKIGCSKLAWEWLFRSDYRRTDKSSILYNCIDCGKFFYQKENRDFLRERLGIGNQKVIGLVGRFVEAKNHVFGIKILESLIDKYGDNYKLVLVGDGILKKRIMEMVNDKIKDSIIFVGEVNDVEIYYSLFDMLLMPSLIEGLPLTMIEAQVSSLPCLISDRIPEDVIVDKDNVFVMSLNQSSESWAKRIKEILEKDSSRNNRIIEEFNVDNVVNQLCTKYTEIDRRRY